MLRRACSFVAEKLRLRRPVCAAQYSSQQSSQASQQSSYDGWDNKHWFVVMDFVPYPNAPPNAPPRTEQELVDLYVKTVVAAANKSEQDAKAMIYSLYTEQNHKGFGVVISNARDVKGIVNNLKRQPDVHWVIPDSYLNNSTWDYGGDKFDSNGQIEKRNETYKPKIHFKFTRILD